MKNVNISNDSILNSKRELLRKIAKQANQRLVRLENKGLTNYSAYIEMERFLLANNGPYKRSNIDENRIPEVLNTIKKMPENVLDNYIREVQSFLGKKTSQAKTINEFERKAAKTLAENLSEEYGKNVKISLSDYKKLGDIFDILEERGMYSRKGKTQIGSDEIVRLNEGMTVEKTDKDGVVDRTKYSLSDIYKLIDDNVMTEEEYNAISKIINIKGVRIIQNKDLQGFSDGSEL